MKNKKVTPEGFCVLTDDQMLKLKGGTEEYARPSKRVTVVLSGNKKQV